MNAGHVLKINGTSAEIFNFIYKEQITSLIQFKLLNRLLVSSKRHTCPLQIKLVVALHNI